MGYDESSGNLLLRCLKGLISMLKPASSQSTTFEGAHVVDPLHHQFLKQDWFDRMEQSISRDDRRRYAVLIGAADALVVKRAPFEAAYEVLLANGLDDLIASMRERDTEPAPPAALYACISAEMHRLIGYWEDPALEGGAQTLFRQALARRLGLEPLPD